MKCFLTILLFAAFGCTKDIEAGKRGVQMDKSINAMPDTILIPFPGREVPVVLREKE